MKIKNIIFSLLFYCPIFTNSCDQATTSTCDEQPQGEVALERRKSASEIWAAYLQHLPEQQRNLHPAAPSMQTICPVALLNPQPAQSLIQQLSDPMALCSICGQGYNNKNSTEEHYNAEHRGLIFKCKNCGKLSKWRAGNCCVNRSLERFATTNLPSFNTLNRLMRGSDNEMFFRPHTDGTFFSCIQCGELVTINELEEHKNSHGTKRHLSGSDNQVATTANSAESSQTKRHENGFECRHGGCDKIFKTYDSRRVHVNAQHKGNRYILPCTGEALKYLVSVYQHRRQTGHENCTATLVRGLMPDGTVRIR